MKNRVRSGFNRRAFFALIVVAVIAAVFTLPYQKPSKAADNLSNSRTESHDAELPNYDIRMDKSAADAIAAFRSAAGRSASDIADHRDAFARGEESLRERVPTLKIVYNDDIRIPEVIGPDVKQGRAFLTQPSAVKRSDILKSFLNEN